MQRRLEFGVRAPVLTRRERKEYRSEGWPLWVAGGHPLYFSYDIVDSAAANIPPNTRVLLITTSTTYPHYWSKSVEMTVKEFDLAKTGPKYIRQLDNSISLKLIGEFDPIKKGDRVWVPGYWFKKEKKPELQVIKEPRLLKASHS